VGLGVLTSVWADDDDDDDQGHHHRHRHEHKEKYKEKFWDGNCKVEREWKHDEYKEKRKCKGAPAPQPVVVYPPWMVVQQSVPVYRAEQVPAVPAAGVFRCQSTSVGQVLGGVVGGVLGNQIGHGNGRALATVGGAIAGVLVGGEIGRRVDAGDQACVGEVLEFAPPGHQVQWAAGPTQYVVVPGAPARRGASYCRPYTFEQQTGAGRQRVQGTACRRPDGVWVAA
jgi:surface antigen